MKPVRVDYDAIADLYDSTPYRTKPVDPQLLDFIGQRNAHDDFSILDVGCGTGSQLIANRPALASARMVGLDRFAGMLHQACLKAADIAWVQADGSTLPFLGESFDFITCQFAFHHISDKAGMLRETFRVLKPGGRFIMRNVCPHECPDWLFYIYFPESLTVDLEDFWSCERLAAEMTNVGFGVVGVDLEHLRFEQDLRAWFDEVRRRGTCSQLLAIPDTAYEAGLHRLTAELVTKPGPLLRENHVCLVTVRGAKD